MENIMGQVKKADYNNFYPYFKLAITKDVAPSDIGVNLRKIYKYIHENYNYNRNLGLGNAYKAIRERAKKNNYRLHYSKREVKSLINYFSSGESSYIKIPYKAIYLFKAIFELVDDKKDTNPLSDDLASFVGKIRRDVFYHEQSVLFDEWFTNTKHNSDINLSVKHLHDDILSKNSPLSKMM